MHIRYIFGNREAGQNLAEQRRLGKEHRSFFPIFFSPFLCFAACALRGGGGGGGFALRIGIALLILSLSVPDADAQQFASRDGVNDISTSGLGLHNKNPRGVWMGVVDGQKVMLVLDARHKKIFTYSMETTPPTRLDNHHNDRAKATVKDEKDEKGADEEYGPTAGADGVRGTDDDGESDDQIIANADDFFLFKTNAPPAPEGHLESEKARNRRHNPYRETNDPLLSLLPNPYGIWSDGSTLWVSDFTDAKIYAYDLTWHRSPIDSSKKYAMGTRASSKDFEAYDIPGDDKGPPKPQGIWANGAAAGSTMWIADDRVKKIFAYTYDVTKGTFRRGNADKDIVRNGLDDDGVPTDPGFNDKDLTGLQGIWSDGATMWVADNEGSQSGEEQKILAYSLTGSRYRDPDKDYRMLGDFGNDRPRGIWSDGETMWVADQTDNKLYAYHALALTSRNEKQDFDDLEKASNDHPTGLWSDGATMWVANIFTNGSTPKLFAYNLATKDRDSDKDIPLAKTSVETPSTTELKNNDNIDPSGLWSDGERMWVLDRRDFKFYVYKMGEKSRDTDKEFALAADNANPTGIWSDGERMWVSDTTDDRLYAYKLELGAGETEASRRVSSREIDVDALVVGDEDLFIWDIWSDGATMWALEFGGWENAGQGVPKATGHKIYAFTWNQGGAATVRDAKRDFNTLDDAGNHIPRGLWSDGSTMWVSDDKKDEAGDKKDGAKIYGYRLSNAASLGILKLTEHVPSKEYEDIENEDIEKVLPPDFDSGTTWYRVSVPYSTESLTVEPKTLRPHDRVLSYSPEDADTTSTNHQVSLGVGQNSLFITVTNGNTNTNSLPRFRTYLVDVTREFFTYNDPSKDILVSTNFTVQGLWANETTLWVSASGTNKLHAYKKADKKADGTRDTERDILLNSANSDPRGLWSNGTIMWVVDASDNKLYAYGFGGARPSTSDIDLDPDNANPQWIWSDGVIVWVSNANDNRVYDRVYAYKLELGSGETESDRRVSGQDILLAGIHEGIRRDATGMWSDGVTLWVSNHGKIYAYKLNAADSPRTIHCPDATEDFNTLEAVGNTDPKGIFSDGSTMWVVDNTTFTNVASTNVYKKIFAYNQPLSANNNLKSLALIDATGDDNVYYLDQPFSQHFSSNETNYTNGVYVLYPTAVTTVTAAAQDPDAGVVVTKPADANLAAPGHQVHLLAESTTEIVITVTAENAAVKEYIVKVDRRSGWHTPINDVVLRMNNSFPIGLWMNEGKTKIWVVENGNDRIYAYALGAEGTGYLSEDSFTQLSAAGNNNPRHIWSDGTTMWVSDKDDKRIYAYKMADKSRDQDKEIAVSVINPTAQISGLWSNDETMWVADAGQNTIYAFNMWTTNVPPVWDGSRDNSKELGSSLLEGASNQNPEGLWSDGETMWVANKPVGGYQFYAYNLEDKTLQDGKSIYQLVLNRNPSPTGAHDRLVELPAEKFSGGFWMGEQTMWVSEGNPGKKIYAFNRPRPEVTRQSEDSEDSTLKELRLSGVVLSPVFSPEKTYYTAQVDHTVNSTTVTATPNDSAAVVEIFWASDEAASRETARRGAQVTLEEGYNLIVMDVTAENGRLEIYFVEITKAEAPPVSGGPLPVFQSASVGNKPSASSSSAAGIEEWKSQFIFAESLLDGGVRFVFLVPAEEFQIEETDNLLAEEWRPLPEDKFQAARESLGHGKDRLTIILPKAAGKQRFLRLMPQR